MRTTNITVQGTVKADGTLELNEKLPLPAGEVQVTISTSPAAPQPERFWKMMESIWANLHSAGRRPRTKEEIDAEIAELRNEAEEEMRAVEQLQQECRQAEQSPKEGQ